ncbi:MAG: hypothetical protein IKL57_00745 [Oscillospiraceae bacterium]|nr:hypothetical protein [Oscillospiraceae bacterium]
MYVFSEREEFFNNIISFFENCSDFEGLIQIGSGAIGFSDIYSDIDLMAGCYDSECVKDAATQLENFFRTMSSCHIEKRAWSDSVLGISVYLKNGLSTDISFMPTAEIPIRSPLHKIIFAKTENFTALINDRIKKFNQQPKTCGADNSMHYRFINELRYAEIALLRKNYIFADIALGNARQLLLYAEATVEGKKLHQFKAYNTLSKNFIEKLKSTYPQNLNYESINSAKENLLSLYVKTVKSSGTFNFDNSLLYLINCFE